MKCKKDFKDKKKYIEYRKRCKKTNYAKGQFHGKVKRKKYTWDEQYMILKSDETTDRELAKFLGTSVQAIQIKRYRLKGGKY